MPTWRCPRGWPCLLALLKVDASLTFEEVGGLDHYVKVGAGVAAECCCGTQRSHVCGRCTGATLGARVPGVFLSRPCSNLALLHGSAVCLRHSRR